MTISTSVGLLDSSTVTTHSNENGGSCTRSCLDHHDIISSAIVSTDTPIEAKIELGVIPQSLSLSQDNWNADGDANTNTNADTDSDTDTDDNMNNIIGHAVVPSISTTEPNTSSSVGSLSQGGRSKQHRRRTVQFATDDLSASASTPPAPASIASSSSPLEDGHQSESTATEATKVAVIMHETLHRSDMSKEEHEAYWLTPQELYWKRRDIMGMIGMLNDGLEEMIMSESDDGDDKDCVRGLESYMRNQQVDATRNRRQLYMEIAGLQSMFRDPHLLIAEACERASEEAVQDARELAIADERYVQTMLKMLS